MIWWQKESVRNKSTKKTIMRKKHANVEIIRNRTRIIKELMSREPRPVKE